MSDAIQKLINAATDLFDADRAEAWRYPTVWEPVVDRLLQACQALQSGEPVVLERVDVHLQIVYDECQIVIEPDPQGSLVYYDNVVRVMQAAQQPPTTKPIAAIKGWFHGECVIQALDPAAVLPAGMALYATPQPVVPELTGKQWSAMRTVIREYAEKFRSADTYEMASAYMDAAPEAVYQALLSAGKGGE
jgi:hypothetical protein